MLNDTYITQTYSYYSTIKDLFDDLSLSCHDWRDMNSNVPNFLGKVDYNSSQKFSTNEQLLDLFQHYIIPSYYDSVIEIQAVDEGSDPDTQHAELLGKIYTWCISTLRTYGVVAKLFDENSDKLLEQIKTSTTSTNRSSDTPELSGAWDGDDQVSAIAASSVETSSDPDTLMGRLEDIRKRYKDIMMLWSKDFYRKFLSEVAVW